MSLGFASLAAANVAPTVVIESAAMRAGTTYMDVVYRVNDPDDATVKVRALAFVNGQRSFANLIKPTTFVEGTGANLGDAIPTNTSRTLTWNAGVDWNVTLGQIKFEVLAMDGRGLLPFDWLTIPAAAGKPAISVGDIVPDTSKFGALAWLLAANHPDLRLEAGKVIGTSSSSGFAGVTLADGYSSTGNGDLYLLKTMNVMPATVAEYDYARGAARIPSPGPGASAGHVKNTPYTGATIVVPIGTLYENWSAYGQKPVKALVAFDRSMLTIDANGVVIGTYGEYGEGPYTDIALGSSHTLALKANGSVVAWGDNYVGETNVPPGLGIVKAIAAGSGLSVVVKENGTVVAWGVNYNGETTVPAGLNNVVAVAAGGTHTIAIKSDGTLVSWGTSFSHSLVAPPAGLTGITAVSISGDHVLALKSDGTVVAWGNNTAGQTNVPAGLSGVVAVSAAPSLSLVLKSDGTVAAWGSRASAVPSGLTHVTAINANGVILVNDVP